MTRPQSIVWFDRFYLASLLLSIVNSALEWSRTESNLAQSPGSEMLPSWFMASIIGFSLAVSLLLWFLISRRASKVAKWINIVLFGFGLLTIPAIITTASTGATSPLSAAATLVAFLLSALAIWMLFRPDAKAWFAGRGDDELKQTFS
jgi:hypothetical protein